MLSTQIICEQSSGKKIPIPCSSWCSRLNLNLRELHPAYVSRSWLEPIQWLSFTVASNGLLRYLRLALSGINKADYTILHHESAMATFFGIFITNLFSQEILFALSKRFIHVLRTGSNRVTACKAGNSQCGRNCLPAQKNYHCLLTAAHIWTQASSLMMDSSSSPLISLNPPSGVTVAASTFVSFSFSSITYRRERIKACGKCTLIKDDYNCWEIISAIHHLGEQREPASGWWRPTW